MDFLILQADDNRLTAARIDVSRRSAELIGATSYELGAEQSLGDAARTIAGNLTGFPHVVLCLSPRLFAQRSVAFTFDDLRKVREVLPAHLQGDIALPVEELVLDVMPAGKGQFIALWARKSDVAMAITVFREAGIEPQTVSSMPFAWSRVPGVPADGAVCDGSTLAFLKEGRLTYFRTFNDAVTAPMVAATLSALEMSGEPLPVRICLIGPDTGGRDDYTAMPLPVVVAKCPPELVPLFKDDETYQQLAGFHAVACAAFDGSLPDFRRGELAWTVGDAKLRGRMVLTGILAVTVILLLFISKALQYRAVAADISSLDTSITAIYHEMFPARAKAVDEVSEIKGEIRKLTGIETSGGCLESLKLLAEAKGSTINGLYEAELEGRNLRIKGDARSAQAVNEFRAALVPRLSASELGEVKSRPDGTVSFSMTGTLKEGTK